MTTRRVAAASIVAVLLGLGCREKAPASHAPAVATFDGGRVTAAAVDRAILDLPPDRRQPADGDLLAWYERVAREIAVQEVLVAEARHSGLDKGPEFEQAREEARRQAVVTVFLDKKLPALPAPTAQEVDAYYREHIDEFRSPPARQTYHLFRRIAPGADPAPVVAEVRRLRDRIVSGESFGTVAAQASESESRHQQGLLGWITPGKVGPELEKVIFSLQPGVPSQPLTTAAGVHLFLVAAETPAKTLTPSEVRNAIRTVLAERRRRTAVEQLVGAEPLPGSFVPEADELKALLDANDPGAVALRAGDLQLTIGQIQRRLLSGQGGPVPPGESPAHALVVSLEQRERAYRKAVEQGIDRSPEAEALLQRLLDRELAGFQRGRRLAERLERDPKRIQDYYQANRARFSTPVRLKIQRMRVPLGRDGNQVMARLEGSRAELEAGRLDFARLAAAVGGTLQEPSWELPAHLARLEGRGVSSGAALRPGRYLPPRRAKDAIEMVRVLERSEPQVQPFEEIRDRVRTDFVVTHREAEYAALVEELLAAKHFVVVKTELEAMLKRPVTGG
jgi:parvulin-like peptidyl-prolyl isomerase